MRYRSQTGQERNYVRTIVILIYTDRAACYNQVSTDTTMQKIPPVVALVIAVSLGCVHGQSKGSKIKAWDRNQQFFETQEGPIS